MISFDEVNIILNSDILDMIFLVCNSLNYLGLSI